MKTARLVIPGLVLGAALACPLPVLAQPVTTTSQISPGVYLIHTVAQVLNFNMNNLLLVGPNGTVLLDTLPPIPPAYVALTTAIQGITGRAWPDTIVNTHWHYDHVGLNAEFRALGTSTIVSHWGVAQYLIEPHCIDDVAMCMPAFPAEAHPTEIVHGEKTLPLENEVLRLKDLENSHSGADLFVLLERANIAYTGDIYFGGMYPIIDRTGGGTVNGMLDALRQLLARIDEHTIVVPSHGVVGTRQSVVAFMEMLETIRKQVRSLIALGLTEEQVMVHPSFAALDAQWGGGFTPGPLFRRIVYRDLVSEGQ